MFWDSYSRLNLSFVYETGLYFESYLVKVNFSKKPAKKNFNPMAGKLILNLALQSSTASTAKIQIQFSRHVE